MVVNYLKSLICKGVLCWLVLLPSTIHAELSAENWPMIKERFFNHRSISPTNLIQIIAPLGAENAAQVPVTLKASNQLQDPIKSIYLLVDANPIPMVAHYQFPLSFNALELSTRIRMENDSHIRAIAETESGVLLMASTIVNAGGGCAGAVPEDETIVRENAGKIKFQINPPYKLHETASASLQIKHPMYTGLQFDTKTKQLKPAFYIQHADIMFEETNVMQIDFNVGTAENPHLSFKFDLPPSHHQTGVNKVHIKLSDNEHKIFNHTINLKP